MATVNVSIKGLNKFKANLLKYPAISKPIFADAIKKSINEIEREAKPRTPIDTGRLRGSYKQKTTLISGEVGPTADYGVYVHEGTRKMKGRPFLADAVESSQKTIDKYFLDGLEKINKIIAKI